MLQVGNLGKMGHRRNIENIEFWEENLFLKMWYVSHTINILFDTNKQLK